MQRVGYLGRQKHGFTKTADKLLLFILRSAEFYKSRTRKAALRLIEGEVVHSLCPTDNSDR